MPNTRRLAVWCALALVSVLPLSLHAQDSSSTVVAGPKAVAADSALRVAESQGFSGIVLVADQGKIVLRKGYGLAVRKPARPFVPSTVVQIGSNTKDFTAVDILQLQEAGKLNVTDSIGKYVPNVPADKRGITIMELLKHRSGLPLYSGLDFEAVSRAQFIAKAMALPLNFAPGTDQSYSNVGYSVLAFIIESVQEDSYGGYTNKHIWQPLGMHDTGLWLVKWDTLRLARGYEGGEDVGTMLDKPHAEDGPYWNIRGNGGFISTVSDMYHFYDVLLNTNELLKPESRDLLFDPGQPMAHAGSDLVSFFLYERAPQQGIVLVMVTNSSDFKAPMARDGVAIAFGLPPMGGGRGNRIGGPSTPVTGKQTAIKLPDTNAGRRAGEYIAVFNSGDETLVGRFSQDSVIHSPDDHRTLEQRLSNYRGMRSQTGALTPVAVVDSKPDEISVKVVTEKGETVVLIVTVESAAPYRIAQIRIEAQ